MNSIRIGIILLLILPLLTLSLMGDYAAFLKNTAQDPEKEVLSEVSSALSEPLFTYTESALSLSAKASVLITAEGGIVYGKNEHTPLEMASTTKIMTALLACEYLEKSPFDSVTKISSNAAATEGSSIYLEVGEEVRLIDLVYAVMLASANDAAVALAEAIGGSVEEFVLQMNEKSAALSLENTCFQNPHGLSEDGHYTTAYALARLMAHAMKNELFARISATASYRMQSSDATRHLQNHNRLLSEDIGVIGGKTGFTKRAGRCLVSVAEKEGKTLYAVTLSAPDDWQDHRALYRYGFSVTKAFVIEKTTLPVHVIAGAKDLHAVSEEVTLTLPLGANDPSLIYELPAFLYAPTVKGDPIGKIVVCLDNIPIAELVLSADSSVEESRKPSFFERLFS